MVRRLLSSSGDYESCQERLKAHGRHIGERMLEIVTFRDLGLSRQVERKDHLLVLTKTVWKSLFGKSPDQVLANAEGFVVVEFEPMTNLFVSQKKDEASLNLFIFIGGIIEAFFRDAGFPCTVVSGLNKDQKPCYFIKTESL
jgi:hypothetical protein